MRYKINDFYIAWKAVLNFIVYIIVIEYNRINIIWKFGIPEKLGALNLHDAIEKYLCGSRVPVYYNNERIGQTYEEIMRAAQEEGEKIYEMTPKM